MTDAKSPAKKQSARRGAKADAAKADETQSVDVAETAAEAPQPDSQAGSVNEADSTAEKVETPEPDKAEQDDAEMPESDPEAAEGHRVKVKAKKQPGFWRCGRFWPFEGQEVIAVEDPTAFRLNEHFISFDDLTRLKAEPMLSVEDIALSVEDSEG